MCFNVYIRNGVLDEQALDSSRNENASRLVRERVDANVMISFLQFKNPFKSQAEKNPVG
jgi:hypothetical protein